MKNVFKVQPTLRIAGVVALLAAAVFSFIACGGDANDGPQTATYTGVSGGTTYTLKITETARYAAQTGDTYELTAGSKKSAGTVSGVSSGVLTLKPSNSDDTFSAKVSGSSLTELGGTIRWTDNTTVTAPGALTSGGGGNTSLAGTTWRGSGPSKIVEGGDGPNGAWEETIATGTAELTLTFTTSSNFELSSVSTLTFNSPEAALEHKASWGEWMDITVSGSTTTDRDTFTGTYTVSGNTVTLTAEGNSITAIISGNILTIEGLDDFILTKQ